MNGARVRPFHYRETDQQRRGGWDAAIKVSALATVLMKHPLTPVEVQPTGIRGITPEKIAAARAAGKRWKLVCSAGYDEQGRFFARVCPEMVGPESPFYSLYGTDSLIVFNTDVLPGLGVPEQPPYTTAYGMLADVLCIAGLKRAMPVVILGLGTNLGDRGGEFVSRQQLRKLTLIRASSVYETEPWGYREQPAFLNQALRRNHFPQRLLALVSALSGAWAEPHFHYGRLIDDILFMTERS